MSRRDEFTKQNTNPAKQFLEWKSDEKAFQYYDKEKQENVKLEPPFKFLTLKEMHTVKGWNDASQSAIFSNEVKFIGSEELTVKSFKGGEIAKGLYKEIKSKILGAGGHYTKSIYAMLEDGTLINFQLKGSAVQQWGEFIEKSWSRLKDEWVEVVEAEEKQKGSIKYTVPVFRFNTSLTDEEAKQADEVYDTLELYMKSYKTVKDMQSNLPPVEDYVHHEDFVPDDNPF